MIAACKGGAANKPFSGRRGGNGLARLRGARTYRAFMGKVRLSLRRLLPFRGVAGAGLFPARAWLKRQGWLRVGAAWLPTVLLVLIGHGVSAQTLSLPPRGTNAPTGSEFAKTITGLERSEREEKIFSQVNSGNVPDFLRKLAPVTARFSQDGKTNTATYYVTPDYLAIGSDEDYFLMPMSPMLAQRVADLLHCNLPTRKMVNDIYAAAAIKLTPSPIPPSSAMTSVEIFGLHNATLRAQRAEQLKSHPPGALVAGHKKDVVITPRLATAPGKVAIYGWHQTNGVAIQPLYLGHTAAWVDYSQCIRLAQLSVTVNGAAATIPETLADPKLAALLSDEGAFTNSHYPLTFESALPPQVTAATAPANKLISLADFRDGPFHERTFSYTLEPEIKVHLNAPADLDAHKPLKLVFYTLPNGNSTEQTIGRQLGTNDWHYDIQHIGAQTRFLRERLSDYNLVVVYLEAAQKSWPAWREKHADLPQRIPEVVNSIKAIFRAADIRITLSGHSGGGSFIFGYLNGVERIPNGVERIAFLDSNYAYDAGQGHRDKFANWLRASDEHHLIVLAYNDAVALLNGTNFVSAAGGTWGRSHQMIQDLGQAFQFANRTNEEFETFSALAGRISFVLKQNPEKKIFHTVQVERNGLIHCLLSGTTNENSGYIYFGPRAYTNWIQSN
ncbi:MAG: hypothetical protein JWR69_17 [Pedosphaera sp.]|nr:hypothetical protein [Pedosphaera sp.]